MDKSNQHYRMDRNEIRPLILLPKTIFHPHNFCIDCWTTILFPSNSKKKSQNVRKRKDNAQKAGQPDEEQRKDGDLDKPLPPTRKILNGIVGKWVGDGGECEYSKFCGGRGGFVGQSLRVLHADSGGQGHGVKIGSRKEPED